MVHLRPVGYYAHNDEWPLLPFGRRASGFRSVKVKHAILSICFRWAVAAVVAAAVVGPRLASIQILLRSVSNLTGYGLRHTLTAHWTKASCRLLLDPGEKTMLAKSVVLRWSRCVKMRLPCGKNDHIFPLAEYTRHPGTCM